MLDDPRARTAVRRFHRQWLRLDRTLGAAKDPAVYPTFTDDVRASAVEETERFVEHVVFDGEGDLRTLLTADYTFVDAELAAFYGIAAPGNAFARTELDATRRAGLLTHASVLAGAAKLDQSSPVLRGLFVRGRLLCDEPPPPPPDVDSSAPEVDPGTTTRERYAQHTEDPACAACHALLDPIGFGFEHYDGVGLWRDRDQNLPVDASGELMGTDVDGEFDGARELAEKLAGSEDVRTCFIEQWFRWAHGRAETGADDCTLDTLAARFDGEEVDVRDLIVALTQTEAFMLRPATGGS
jgi:hypothetical protein